jgi:peptide/nickel transport system substrate-binding protein
MTGVVKYKIDILIFLLLAVFLFGCQPDYKMPDDHIRIRIASDPATLNPITSSDSYASQINNYIFDSLIKLDKETLEIKPHIATHWDISEDKKIYTFYLRKDVTWQDGQPFTAEDIVYTYNNVFMNPELKAPALKSYYKDIKRVYKKDEYTVVFEYDKIYFRALLMCGAFPTVPKHIVSQYKDFDASPFSRHPIGNGPYKFKEWVTNGRIVLELNENYWGKKPAIRVIDFRVIADSAIALQILKKGELDLFGLSSIQWARQTESKKFKEQFQVIMYPSKGYSFLGWKNDHPFFSDVRVRHAMTHLIDRQKINEKMYFGLGIVVTGPFYPYSKQYNQDVKPLKYDLEKAKELLSEAGWRDSDGDGILDKDGKKFEFTFLFPGSKTGERLGTIYKEQLKKAGIIMNMSRMEWAAFLNKLDKRDFELVVLAWSTPIESDPYQLWHKSQAAKERSSNFIGFVHDEASALIDKARVEFNEEKRNKMYWRFHEIIAKEQPYTFLFNQPSILAVSRRFGNVIIYKTGIDIKEWTIKSGSQDKK